MFGISTKLYKSFRWLMVPEVRRLKSIGIDYDAFKRHNLQWLKNLNIEVIIDIGAHTGSFSAVMHEVIPESAIVAFEPLPDCYQNLRRRLDYISRFTAHNVAISDTDGIIEFYQSSWAESSSTLQMADLHKQNFPYSSENKKIVVPCVTLDRALVNFKDKNAMMVKMDVQGGECRVITGGQETLRRASVVWVETSFVELYHGQALFSDVFQQLSGLGYEFRGNFDQSYSSLDDSVLQSDSIFVRCR